MTKRVLRELPIGAILNGPNVRAVEENEELEELALSISRQGYLAPVGAVEEAGETVILLYGFRRVAAYHLGVRLGLPMPETIPVLVYANTLTLVERESVQLIENLLRVDLSEVERYKAVKSLASRGLTLDQIGDQLGKNKSTISKWLSGVDRCPEEAQKHFLDGRLSLSACYEISTSPDPLATLRALLRGESQEAGRRAGRKAAAERSDTPKEKAPRVAVPLPPADESGSSGSVTVCGQAGQGIDLVESERLLLKALKLVRDALKEGLTPRAAQAAWKAHASAKPGALADAAS